MQVAVGLARPGPDIVHFYRKDEVSKYPKVAVAKRPTQDEMGYGEK